MHLFAGHVVGFVASLAEPKNIGPAGKALPTSEVEQSLIYCKEHKFADDNLMRPIAAPLFSEDLLQHWRHRYAMHMVICCQLD